MGKVERFLMKEYCDFEDMVLLESPFAETTRDGLGIRQVQLGLTPTKLILATDILKNADDAGSCTACLEAGKIGLDPEIESLELVSVFPVEAVNISVFRKKHRNTLKAHFCNDVVLYFELGGIDRRRMFWNLWRERVKFLSPGEGGSSLSETSVGSSSSASTLYIVDSSLMITGNGKTQLFCNYGILTDSDKVDISSNKSVWKDKDLYLGPGYCSNDFSATESMLDSIKCMKHNNTSGNNNGCNYTNCKICRYNSTEEGLPSVKLRSSSSASILERGPSCMHFINRFGYGIPENEPVHFMQQNAEEIESVRFIEVCKKEEKKETIANSFGTELCSKRRHIRRYAFAPQPHFLHGLGPWKVSLGETYSIQIKKAVSSVSVRRQPVDQSFRLPISRRQLTTTISCEALHIMPQCNPARVSNIKFISPTSPLVFFWTPDYWYRPRSARAVYSELQHHLQGLRQMRNCDKLRAGTERNQGDGLGIPPLINMYIAPKKKGKLRSEVTSNLKRLLRMDESYTAWSFDSCIIAYQLTMIDRDLFLKIPVVELAVLIWQQSSKFAPNIGALIAFSHRISCLIATEILQEQMLQKRARLVARFISVAEKCHKLRNFQSTRSILCGLQSPPIYRLRDTWTYLRQHHATKYQRMEKLCRRYRDPRLPIYQQMFKQESMTPPYLPSVAHIVCLLLDRLEEFPDDILLKRSPSSSLAIDNYCNIDQGWKAYMGGKTTVPKSLQRILSAFRIWQSPSEISNCRSRGSCVENLLQSESHSSLLESKMNRFLSSVTSDEESEALKAQHLEHVSTLFVVWQKSALLYALQETQKAKDYLLKARYREDKENFRVSLKLEKRISVLQEE